LREKLLATGDFSVVLTRERDVFLSLSERVRIAQAANADLMLSIHANTVTLGDAYGATVYSLSALILASKKTMSRALYLIWRALKPIRARNAWPMLWCEG